LADLLNLAPATERIFERNCRVGFRVFEDGLVQLVANGPGLIAVDGDLVRHEFQRERLGETQQTLLLAA